MTCKEKWELEHPGKNFDEECIGVNGHCPWHYRYLHSPDYCGDLRTNICEECWGREIPEENKEETNMTNTKKTKVELMEEIAELEKQVNELEKYKTYKNCGDDLKAIHTAFMDAGFANEQAFHLMQTMIQGSIMNSAVDAVKVVTRHR